MSSSFRRFILLLIVDCIRKLYVYPCLSLHFYSTPMTAFDVVCLIDFPFHSILNQKYFSRNKMNSENTNSCLLNTLDENLIES